MSIAPPPPDTDKVPRRARRSGPPFYGFPATLMDWLSTVEGLGPSSRCGLCGDTILGQRHRIIDAIAERLVAGDFDVGDDYGVREADLWICVAASYEHDKALRRQRRSGASEGSAT